MNPKTLSYDRTSNVSGQVGEGTFCPRQSAAAEGGLPGEEGRRHSGVEERECQKQHSTVCTEQQTELCA